MSLVVPRNNEYGVHTIRREYMLTYVHTIPTHAIWLAVRVWVWALVGGSL